MKKTSTGRKSKTSTKRAGNREFVIITYLFVAVFIMMMGYFAYFQVFKSEDFINSPYNTRQNTFAEHVVRGEILSSDEKVLAQTVVGEDGSESRYYPYGAMFAHAVVVLDTATGKILAMVSKPDFDPNSIASQWESIISNTDSENSVLVNRVTQGLYPPGSTFKILTTLEYMRENSNYQDYSYDCQGSITMENTEIHCYANAVHGAEDLQASFAKSCNTSYANIGLSLNRTKFAGLCRELLFDADLPVPYPFNKSSFVLDKSSNTDQVTQMAIGQGETLVTPMHMALITSAIANNGTLMRPYIIDHTENYRGVTVKNYKPSVYSTLISEGEAGKLQELMSLVVSEGTGSQLNGQSYQAAGKTGSAEFSNVKGESHAWFTGYASTEEKGSIAVTVIVENGGAGSTAAVPIAKQVFDTYFAQ